MSKPCTATGSTGVALAATLTKPGSSGTSRPHHASRAAAAVWASVMLTLVEWLLAEKARWRAEAKCVWCPDQCCQTSDAQPDIENMTAESRSNHHCRRSISRPPAIEPRPDTDRIAPEVQGEDHGGRRNISRSWRRSGVGACRSGRARRRKCRSADGATLPDMARSLGPRLPPALVDEAGLGYFLLGVEDVLEDVAAGWEGGMRITSAVTYAPPPALDAAWARATLAALAAPRARA